MFSKLLINVTNAQTPTLTNPLGAGTTIPVLLDRIMTGAIPILGTLAGLMVLVGAGQMLLSSGNPEKFAKGGKTVLYAAIGFTVVLMAKGITAIIKNVLTV